MRLPAMPPPQRAALVRDRRSAGASADRTRDDAGRQHGAHPVEGRGTRLDLSGIIPVRAQLEAQAWRGTQALGRGSRAFAGSGLALSPVRSRNRVGVARSVSAAWVRPAAERS